MDTGYRMGCHSKKVKKALIIQTLTKIKEVGGSAYLFGFRGPSIGIAFNNWAHLFSSLSQK